VSGSSLGEDLSNIVGMNGQYYLQITSGDLEGERFDILSGGVDEITLMNDPDIFSELDGAMSAVDGVSSLNTQSGVPADADLNGASYQIIRYKTIDDVFDKEATYAGHETGDPNDATRLLFYNNRLETAAFEVLILVGSNTMDSKWILSDDLGAQVDQGTRRLDPAGGNWIHPKISNDSMNPGAQTTQTAFGMVASHAQAVALNAGSNLTGAMWPLEQTPAGPNGRDLTVTAPASLTGGVDPDNSPELLFWNGDAVVDNPAITTYDEGYENYMLLDGGGMQNWVDINDINLTNLDNMLILEPHRAIFLKILAGNEKESHIYPQPAF